MLGGMSPVVAVEEVDAVDDALVRAFAKLVPQVSTAAPPGRPELQEIAASPSTVLLVARTADGSGEVVGSLSLVVVRIPTGVRALIEDVVVDESARRQRVGSALMAAAIDRARMAGARTVDLTSRPSREAANAMYRKLGFERRSTNLYRLDLAAGHGAP